MTIPGSQMSFHETAKPVSAQSMVLTENICRRIHYSALCDYRDGLAYFPIPQTLPLQGDLLRSVKHFGNDILIYPNQKIRHIFQGITLGDFEQIEDLFCSPLLLSVPTVFQILTRRNQHSSSRNVSYEAVWAICNYLRDLRNEVTRVDCIYDQPDWLVSMNRIPRKLIKGEGLVPLAIITVISSTTDEVIGFRPTSFEEPGDAVGLALYDAIILNRQPSPSAYGNHGLIWSLPQKILVDFELPTRIFSAITDLKIKIIRSTLDSEVLTLIRSPWTKDLFFRKVSVHQIDHIFGNFLKNKMKFSPIKEILKKNHEFRKLTGFNYDPASIFPELRNLLPVYPASISQKGEINFQNLHYENEILNFWPDTLVSIRASEETDTTIWVYLPSGILCVAKARERRRSNGKYRFLSRSR
jgi:hypothetical protein